MKHETKLVLTAASGLLVSLVSLPAAIGPLICMLVWKEDPDVESFARRCINVQLSWLIWILLAGLSCLAFVGIILLPLTIIMWLVCSVVDVVKTAYGDTSFRFPFTIDFLGINRRG